MELNYVNLLTILNIDYIKIERKGFVTNEDMLLIENSYRDEVNPLINNNNNNNKNMKNKNKNIVDDK